MKAWLHGLIYLFWQMLHEPPPECISVYLVSLKKTRIEPFPLFESYLFPEKPMPEAYKLHIRCLTWPYW